MKDFVNWAILAPGNIAASMAKAMKGSAEKDGRIKLYCVASRNLERAKAFADQWGFEKAYGSYEELYSDPEVDAVYIANPHAFHCQSTLDCLRAGKHVLCEKPAGCNSEQLESMIKAAKEKKLFFMEAMWTAFNPTLKVVKKWIDDGKIGKVLNMDSYFCNRNKYEPHGRLFDPDQAGGAILDVGIYNLYFSLMMNDFENPKIQSSAARIEKGVDFWNTGVLEFPNGTISTYQDAVALPTDRTTHDAWIFGEKGYIYVQNFFLTQYAELHTYTGEWGNDNKLIDTAKIPFDINGYEYELRHSTECILQGKIESPVHTWEKSRQLCGLMDDLRKAWGLKYPFEK